MAPTPTQAAHKPAPTSHGSASLTERLDAARPYVLSLFRIVVGLLFAVHGIASLFGVLGGAAGTDGGTIAAGTWPGWYAAMIQLVCGLLVMIGAGTRGAALIASGSMAYAYFETHQKLALWPIQNGGEAAVMFCWAFLLLVFTGPGPIALSRLYSRGR
ncbi:DoxX family protein [Streptomyces sp. AV19]|uniref:DoxX family protein n=1 Tax=Streptomyces sp. AV19 TaxID=2793068 RepID=UPI0018FEF664|nr:DoxX family protein [Streptomyces sp. AV19]MBH1935178.1 DoxX family protein [Streptomyces sp. AV19]MDG4532006.1 DoxX family protein [Streptomyces sp. AV19]